jgi:transcriptional regulator with XRE-family HTH domain
MLAIEQPERLARRGFGSDTSFLGGFLIGTLRGGVGLKQLRTKAGLTTREVAELSQKIAVAEGNQEHAISHARMIQIENGKSTPSVYKLFSLSAIYGASFDAVASLYVDLRNIVKHQIELPASRTRLADFSVYDNDRPVSFPVRFDPGFNVEKTNFLPRMVEAWGDVPAGLLAHLNLRHARYGFIGLTDYTMFPLLRPGSFVQIEEQDAPPERVAYRTEFDRPIWFLELRDGYVCSWCEFERGCVTSVPHPLSPARTHSYRFPQEAELVGRVTAVAARLVNYPPPERIARPPKQS